MKRVILCLILTLFAACEDKGIKENRRVDVIKSDFVSEETYEIRCNGYPKGGLSSQIQRTETAKEAALTMAQYEASQRFDNVDPVRDGIVKEYKVYDDHVEIIYQIKGKNLREKKR